MPEVLSFGLLFWRVTVETLFRSGNKWVFFSYSETGIKVYSN